MTDLILFTGGEEQFEKWIDDAVRTAAKGYLGAAWVNNTEQVLRHGSNRGWATSGIRKPIRK
ncbi:MAG TPA: hypothetical protein VME23_21455 [Terracidiphilus sp.]|nr:hypothetical protein [Terracidiphilus sp.]